jgi:hypothetical protein
MKAEAQRESIQEPFQRMPAKTTTWRRPSGAIIGPPFANINRRAVAARVGHGLELPCHCEPFRNYFPADVAGGSLCGRSWPDAIARSSLSTNLLSIASSSAADQVLRASSSSTAASFGGEYQSGGLPARAGGAARAVGGGAVGAVAMGGWPESETGGRGRLKIRIAVSSACPQPSTRWLVDPHFGEQRD